MAHKLAGGTAKNLRDSKGQRLGIKKFGGEAVKSGNIIVRQRGTKWHPGKGVSIGRDHTIFAIQEGVVQFTKQRKMKFNGRTYKNTVVNVVSQEVKKTAPKKAPAKKVEKTEEKTAPKKAPAKKPAAKKTPAKKTEAKK